MAHWRSIFYQTLNNKHVLEIGALNSPAPLNGTNNIEYLDCADSSVLQASFHEVTDIVKPDYIVNLFNENLPFNNGIYDIVIMNHVIEHIKNPIKLILDCFRVLKNDGILIISCPDKHYTFDHSRAITDLSVLEANYIANNSTPFPEDYLDFITHVSKETANHKTEDRLNESLLRKEHIYTYSDISFKKLLLKTKELGNLDVEPIYEVMSDKNRFEYFGVWRIKKCL